MSCAATGLAIAGAVLGSVAVVWAGREVCLVPELSTIPPNMAPRRAGGAPQSGLDLARTVARLDRGWVGAFVTTGYFSDQAQREVVADRFPLLMLNGRHVGETMVKESALRGLSVPDYIAAVDAEYDGRLSNRLPAEILRD